MSAKRRDLDLGELPEDMDMEEIREFLEADAFDPNADPAFVEALRRKLWELVDSGISPDCARPEDR